MLCAVAAAAVAAKTAFARAPQKKQQQSFAKEMCKLWMEREN